MSVANPQLFSVSPQPYGSGIVLRQPVIINFTGPSLIDPRSWGSHTFAIYGPGDVVYDQGPGTILNSGIVSNPYVLIDGVTLRERVTGNFSLTISGTGSYQVSGNIGISGTNVLGTFIPDAPLRANTEYEVVLVGDDNAGHFLEGSGRYLGITSWTSDATFTKSGVQGSGNISILTSYDRILPSIVYDSTTGYNDTYRIVITSGSNIGQPLYTWSQLASPGTYPGNASGIQTFGNNLTFQFSGIFQSGEIYSLDVYIPKPLLKTYTWKFATSELNTVTPPYVPQPPPTVVDNTGGGFLITSGVSDGGLKIVGTWPDNLEYAVISGLPCVVFQFNKELDPYLVISGKINISDFVIRTSPLAGMPNIAVTPSFYPSQLQVSGAYLFLWL